MSRRRIWGVVSIAGLALVLTACEPEVGSADWCADMKDKPKGEWTLNETADFTKHCLIDSLKSE